MQVAVERYVLLETYRAAGDAVEREVGQRILAADRAGNGDGRARRDGQVFGGRACFAVDLAFAHAENAHMAVGRDDLPIHAVIDADAVVYLDEAAAGGRAGGGEIVRLARADDDQPAAAFYGQRFRLEIAAGARRPQTKVVLERRHRRIERVRAILPPDDNFVEPVLEEGDLVAVEVEHVRLRDGDDRRGGVIAPGVDYLEPDDNSVLDEGTGCCLRARQRNDNGRRRVVARAGAGDRHAGHNSVGIVRGSRRRLVSGRFATLPAADDRHRRQVLGVVSRSAVDEVDACHQSVQNARNTEGSLAWRRHGDQRFGGIPAPPPEVREARHLPVLDDRLGRRAGAGQAD